MREQYGPKPVKAAIHEHAFGAQSDNRWTAFAMKGCGRFPNPRPVCEGLTMEAGCEDNERQSAGGEKHQCSFHTSQVVGSSALGDISRWQHGKI
jgi:hypothetical protein